MRRRLRTRRTGYVATDAIMALAIVLVLIGILTTAVARQRRGGERLAESRAAVRLAEATLTAMQTASPPPAVPEGFVVRVRSAEAPNGLRIPTGCAWVDVEVSFSGRSTRLAGLARTEAVKGATP